MREVVLRMEYTQRLIYCYNVDLQHGRGDLSGGKLRAQEQPQLLYEYCLSGAIIIVFSIL